jgi:uncharacterized protein (TIGR03435 family)
MRRFVLWMIAVASFSGCALFAQDLTGQWQGTLSAPGRDLRTVFKITKDDGNYRTIFYSIDQGSQGIPASVTTLQGSNLKMTIPGLGGSYEAKLSADGNSMAGTWTQGPMPLLLNLVRANAETAWAIPAPPAPLKPMAADANPSFEVATIKPSKPDTPGKGFRVQGRAFSTVNTSLVDLIGFAYGVHPRQITGGAAWMESDRYDISAKPDGEGMPNDRQWKSMLQKLLKERFKLTFHNDKKELSVYSLVMVKTGHKLTPSAGDPNGLPGVGFRRLGDLIARNATMTDFAGTMQGTALDRPVLDQTLIKGRFDFTLTWTPDEFQFTNLGVKVPTTADNPNAPPDLYTAIQQQLGLKLEPTKLPTEVLVIDKVEKPSEN